MRQIKIKMTRKLREYAFEDDKFVDLEPLKSEFVEESLFRQIHSNSTITAHDAFIEYQGGILLVTRNNFPAKGILWCIGGKIERGVPTENSLKRISKKECGLNLSDLEFIDSARQFWQTDPFGHGKGTDTPSYIYFARGHGELTLDSLHKGPIIVKPEDYTKQFRQKLHPYIRDFMDICIKKIKNR